MVARKPGAESSPFAAAVNVFELWRRWLSGRIWAVIQRTTSNRDGAEPMPGYAAAPQPPAISVGRSDPIGWTAGALLALMVASAVRIALAKGGSPRLDASLAAGFGVLLALLRLGVLVRALQDSVRPGVAVASWARGTVIWAIAINPALSLVAWAVSGLITVRSLTHRGVPVSRAQSATGAAWGVHALAVLSAWMATNVWVAVLAR